MKTALIFLATVTLVLLSSCTNETEPGAPIVTYPISYMVESTGATITVDQVQYVDSDGNTVTILTPALPWSATAVMSPGQTGQLAVTGSTGATSEITARIQDDPAEVTGAPVTYAEQTCGENTPACAIDISNNF